ncbi:MAG: hypothetical protein HeimC3_33040 [Candidatus Heimdallarchaeota archaeon LC_3]|nr:MAG: hypothetical protein HeimC3_33040 [Candidatus Heimdallarchaeota archaeon LC_3]
MNEEIEIINKVNDVLKTFVNGINEKFKEIDSKLSNITKKIDILEEKIK